MRNPISLLFLILFAVSVLVTYLTTRRTQHPVLIVALVGGVLFLLYSLSVGNPFVQALVLGLVLGALFDALCVTAALFFRQIENTDQPSVA